MTSQYCECSKLPHGRPFGVHWRKKSSNITKGKKYFCYRCGKYVHQKTRLIREKEQELVEMVR